MIDLKKWDWETLEKKIPLSDWKGKVLVNAHKTLRDNLIEISLQ